MIAQVLRPTQHQMRGDEPRPHVVAAIHALFTDRRSTEEYGLDGAGAPCVVIAPELAIGSGDWEEVDRVVHSAQGNAIVIVGCGHVRGKWLEEWLRTSTSTTKRCSGWPHEEQSLLLAKLYNVGFAWIKTGDECRCAVFLKNYADQSVELAAIPELATGDWMTRLEVEDLVIFPTICSDLLGQLAGGLSAARRIRASLDSASPGDKRVLVTGSLCTPRPGAPHWRRAVAHLTDTVGSGHVLVLANTAEATKSECSYYCCGNAEEDRWRNRSGVFKPVPALSEHDRSPAHLAIHLRDDLVVASVVRESFALIQSGTISWSSSITNKAFLWHPTVRAILSPIGAISDIEHARLPLTYEAHALARRQQKIREVGLGKCTSSEQLECAQFRLAAASALLSAIDESEPDVPAGLVRTIVCGLGSCAPDWSHFTSAPVDWEHLDHLTTALDAIGIISHVLAPTWEAVPGYTDRVMQSVPGYGLVVWSTPFQRTREMVRAISGWQSVAADATQLVVIGQSASHDFPHGSLPLRLPRQDITQGEAPSSDRDITRARVNRRVHCVQLTRLLDECETPSDDGEKLIVERARLVIDLPAEEVA